MQASAGTGELKDEDFREHFSQFGEIEDCAVGAALKHLHPSDSLHACMDARMHEVSTASSLTVS